MSHRTGQPARYPHPHPAMRVRTLASAAQVTRVETFYDGRTLSAQGAVTEHGVPVLLVAPGNPLHEALVGAAAEIAARVTLQAPRELAGHRLVRFALRAHCGSDFSCRAP